MSSFVRRQRGFTIIELMVAMVIGLLILQAVLSIFSSSKRSQTTRDSMSTMQENGRVAISRLQRGLSPAGYPMYQNNVPIVLGDLTYPGMTGSADGDTAPGDRVTIAFRPGELGASSSYTEDCLGNTRPLNGMTVNSYFVDAGSSTLRCEGSGNVGRPQPLAEGVESMQVLYGLDNNSDGYADNYLTASQLDLQVSGNQDISLAVVSIRVSILVNSLQLAKDSAGAKTYNLLGVSVQADNDFLQRRVFTTTIPLRNRMPL